jgi:prophage regulatory protein
MRSASTDRRVREPSSSSRSQVMPQTDPSRFVVRFPDVARELGVSPTTLRKLCKQEKGPPLIRLSERCFGVRRGELDAWIETRKVGGP